MKKLKTFIYALAVSACMVFFSGCILLSPTNPYTETTHRAKSKYISSHRPRIQSIQEPLTLSKAIEIALSNNPELGTARYKIDKTKADHDIAIAAILPKLGIEAGYDHYLDRHRLGPPRYIGERRTYSDGVFASHLVLNMPLFAGGRLISNVQATQLLQTASEQQLAHNEEELIYNVSSVFYSIMAQHHVIESLVFSQKTLKQHLKRITELMQAQKAAKVDRLRTEVRIADLEEKLLNERNILDIQGRILTNLLGVSKGNTVPVEIVGKLEINAAPVMDVKTATEKALAQRNDYLAMRAILEAHSRKVDIERAKRWPRLNLHGSYGGLWASGRVDRNGDDSFDEVGSVGFLLDIPLFEGGRINAGIRRERSNMAATQEKMRKIELQIRLDVQTALLNISSSSERMKATEISIEQAKESLRIEQKKYAFGKGAITDVLDAQSALLNTQVNYYRALADYNTSLAQYELALGETGY